MIFSHFGGSGLALRPILRISGVVVSFSLNKCTRGLTPPKASSDPLFQGHGFAVFLECSLFLMLVIFSAQRLHFCIHFDTFLGALGLFKNC